MANWQMEPSFVHVFWSLPELLMLLLLLWVVITCFLGCFSRDEVFELFWQDFAPNIFKMETKGFWLLEVRLCNRFWGRTRNGESCLLSRWPETFTAQQGFVLNLYSTSLLHKKDLRFLPPKQHLSAHAVSNLLCFLAVMVSVLQKSSHLVERSCGIGTNLSRLRFFVMMMMRFWAIEN